jgi:Tfp pilus assembly protein PilF
MEKTVRILTAFILIFTWLCRALYSQSSGEKLFMTNRPEAAVPLLEKELEQDAATDPVTYIYLGLAYYQTGDYARSVSVFEKGMQLPGADIYTFALNAGNSAFAMKNYGKAYDFYTSAMNQDPQKSAPVLNRANTLLKQGKLGDALADYKKFIAMAPQDPQTAKIQQLVQLVGQEIEKRKKAAEKISAQTELLTGTEGSFTSAGEPASASEAVPVSDIIRPTVSVQVGSDQVVPDDSRLPVKTVPVPGSEPLPVQETAAPRAEASTSGKQPEPVYLDSVPIPRQLTAVPEPVNIQNMPAADIPPYNVE